MSVLRILVWGHRRAIAPIEALRALVPERLPGVAIETVVRPLSDFEHQGIEEAAKAADLVIFDHPFCGSIVASGAFVALDDLLPELLGPEADPLYVGPSLRSYRYAGKIWGAPIDAATQHAAYRGDLLSSADEPVPATWQDVLSLGGRLASKGLKLGNAVETPHALMTIGSLSANAGRPWIENDDGSVLMDRDAFAEAYDLVSRLNAFCPPEAFGWNSIDLHDAMVERDDVAYCPAVYGYATYGESDMRRPLSFAPFAGAHAPHAAGSLIGGTAFGVSRYCADRDAAIKLVALALDAQVQTGIFGHAHGQPGRVESWKDPRLDDRFGGFFSATRETLETAAIRPRASDWPAFQAEAGRRVARAMAERANARTVAAEIAGMAERMSPGG